MGKTVAGEPTGLTAERYAEVPDHPLNGVPQDVLDAARVPMCEALITKDVDVENAYPLADAVLSAALPALLRWWTQDTTMRVSWADADTRVTWYDAHDHEDGNGPHSHSIYDHHAGALLPRTHDGVGQFVGTATEARSRWESSAPVCREDLSVSVGDNSDRPGASHYSAAVQPIDLIDANDMGFYEGSVVKYVTRWVRKNGLEDLEKAVWYLNRLLNRARAARSVDAEDGGTGAA